MIHQNLKHIIGAAFALCIIVGLSVFIYLMTNNKIVFGYDIGYQPTQPIPFSHKVHVGQLGIDCRYCHTTVEVSRHATVPSLNICMNCHIQVRNYNGKPNPWIAKVASDYYQHKPIRWVRVHMLPDFVKFWHAPHIDLQWRHPTLSQLQSRDPAMVGTRRTDLKCLYCHGEVQEMSVIKQYAPLSMGWCVNCHRRNGAPTTCGTCHM